MLPRMSVRALPELESLHSLSRSFGAAAARRKLDILNAIDDSPRIRARDLLALHDLLCFMRAYPDNAQVLARVEAMAAGLRERADAESLTLRNTGFPGAAQCYEYSYGTLLRLVRLHPGRLDIAWDELEDEFALHNALVLVVTVGECQGLDDIRVPLQEWVERAKPDAAMTGLEFVLDLFERSALRPDDRAYIYDSCHLRVRFDLATPGTGRCEMALEPGRIHYQRTALGGGDRKPLSKMIRTPPPRARRAGRSLLDLAANALACRNIEIAPLINANPNDIVFGDFGRGLRIALIGTVPEQRDPLEISYLSFVLKNGVPIAYGPASIGLGCCELGLNLLPEFRGSEIPFIYGQYMRCLYHFVGAQNFFLTHYAMGEGNAAAVRTGAFWFYRKMGFSALNPKVEALAREEEKKMRARPGYRSDLKMLRRLSHTEGSLDLSGGSCDRLDFGAIGLRQSRLIAERFGGDRALAERRCSARVAKTLGIEDLRRWSHHERRALRILAPLLSMLPELASWSPADKKRAVRVLRLKGSRSEMKCDIALRAHRRLERAIRSLAARPPEGGR
jgi:hypothetical protein